MRKLLNFIYSLSGTLAAASVVGITLLVFGQVLLNVIDYLLKALTGSGKGMLIPSYALLSGYALAFATFLSLGLGLRQASHIRVTVIETRLNPVTRRGTLTLVALIGVGLGALLAYSLGELAYQSYSWGDTSEGLLSIPLWIPQTALCLGASMFTIAALDTLVEMIRTGDSAALHNDDPTEEGV